MTALPMEKRRASWADASSHRIAARSGNGAPDDGLHARRRYSFIEGHMDTSSGLASSAAAPWPPTSPGAKSSVERAIFSPELRRPSFAQSDASTLRVPEASIRFPAPAADRASLKLRAMLEHVESTESWVDFLQDHNYRLRVRMLQKMRGHTLLDAQRVAWAEWRALVEATSGEKKLVSLRNQMMARFLPLFLKMMPGAHSGVMLKTYFKAWSEALDSLCEENRLLDEIDLHRQGRAQLIQQYRELEAEFLNERHVNAGLREELNESLQVVEKQHQDLGESRSRLEVASMELQAAQERADTYALQLAESQDRAASHRRDLFTQTEKAKHLAQQVEQGDEDRKDVVDRLHRAEKMLEKLRLEAVHREAELRRSRELCAEKDQRLRALEQQVADAHSCIHGLSHGASMYLRSGAPRGVSDSSFIFSPSKADLSRSKADQSLLDPEPTPGSAFATQPSHSFLNV